MSVDTNKVDAIFSEWNRSDSPGCTLVVIKDEKIVYKRGYGMANLEHDIPITTTTVFDIASTSKQFTALSIVLLAKQKKLSLDDNIQKYVPEFDQYDQPITIRHLIHHTSGIRDYLTLMYLAGLRVENEYPEEEIIDLICRQKNLDFEPGSEFSYSNSGYLLLATIVKRASGKSLRDFANEWIFSPLGMNNSHFHDDFTEIVKNRATGYSKKDEGGYRIDMTYFDVVGDGGLYTTAEDLFLWDQNFYHNIIGGIGDELITEITTPGKLNDGELLNYAFGLGIEEYKGLRMVSHGGGWMGYRSELVRFPEERISVICLANNGSINATELARKVADLYLSIDVEESQGEVVAKDEIKPINLPVTELEKKTGFYQHEKSAAIWEIMLDDGKLLAKVGGMKFKILPTHQRIFHSFDFQYSVVIEFGQESETGSTQIEVSVEGHPPEKYVMVKADDRNDTDLQEYVATYHSTELNVSYKLKLKDEKLFLERKGAPEETLKPIEKDFFKGKFISLQFTRNEELEIDGFSLGAGSVTNLRFDK